MISQILQTGIPQHGNSTGKLYSIQDQLIRGRHFTLLRGFSLPKVEFIAVHWNCWQLRFLIRATLAELRATLWPGRNGDVEGRDGQDVCKIKVSFNKSERHWHLAHSCCQGGRRAEPPRGVHRGDGQHGAGMMCLLFYTSRLSIIGKERNLFPPNTMPLFNVINGRICYVESKEEPFKFILIC